MRSPGPLPGKRRGAPLLCPLCGQATAYRGHGCSSCGASQEDIDRMEPGPWDGWGD